MSHFSITELKYKANDIRTDIIEMLLAAKSAKASRHDDHVNILCLPSDYVSLSEAKKIVTEWLETPWGKEKRHERRVREVGRLEKITKK